jgi:hypothetical protein
MLEAVTLIPTFLLIFFLILFIDLYLLVKKYLKLKIEALQRENEDKFKA